MNKQAEQAERQIGKIISQRTIAQNYMEMTVQWTARLPIPGQFFMLLPPNWPIPILRRPFAYSQIDGPSFSFIYEIRGRVTEELSRMNPGDSIDWIGPLGTGFPCYFDNRIPILVSGGVGIGPIYCMANYLRMLGKKSVVVIGARSKQYIPDLFWFKESEVHISTEDGSMGIQGTVLDILKTLIFEKSIFYSCGPWSMLRAVHQFALELNSPSWVSVEEYMACGIGYCQSCAVPVLTDQKQSQYKRACLEGPVFDSQELIWT